jgi:LacI family transcriptional regulator
VTEELLAVADPASAIYITGVLAAVSVMESLLLEGLNFQNDLSLIGFDDVPQASSVYPRLTTIHNPLCEMGQTAVRMLLDQIQNPALEPEHVQLPTKLVTRESCFPRSPV